MAKKTDPFDKFREATLGSGKTLSGALSGAVASTTVAEAEASPAPAKVSKNADRKLVSFHIDKGLFLKLGQLKFELGCKYDDLYNEAIENILQKYGKL